MSFLNPENWLSDEESEYRLLTLMRESVVSGCNRAIGELLKGTSGSLSLLMHYRDSASNVGVLEIVDDLIQSAGIDISKVLPY